MKFEAQQICNYGILEEEVLLQNNIGGPDQGPSNPIFFAAGVAAAINKQVIHQKLAEGPLTSLLYALSIVLHQLQLALRLWGRLHGPSVQSFTLCPILQLPFIFLP